MARARTRPTSDEAAVITAVADTNIYISAMLFGGPCETILSMARAGLIDLSHSPAIERERSMRPARAMLRIVSQGPPKSMAEM